MIPEILCMILFNIGVYAIYKEGISFESAFYTNSCRTKYIKDVKNGTILIAVGTNIVYILMIITSV